MKTPLCMILALVIFLCSGLTVFAAQQATIKQVETDSRSYVNEYVSISGTIDVSSRYLSGYSKAGKTHFAFVIKDRTGKASVYMQRSRGTALRERILAANSPVAGEFIIRIRADRYKDNTGKLTAELESYSF